MARTYGAAFRIERASPDRQQVAIWVSISDQVNEADDGGGVAKLAETISERLKQSGHFSARLECLTALERLNHAYSEGDEVGPREVAGVGLHAVPAVALGR